MTAQHTPGPWTAHQPDEELDKHHWTIRAPGNREGIISFEVARISGRNNETDESNANLIAAAPDLLNELRQMCHAYVRLLENGRDRIIMLGGDCDPLDRMEADDPNLREARAAITKAIGATANEAASDGIRL